MQFTTNEWAILLLTFVLGWLLGLLSRHSAGHWRSAYEAERARADDLGTAHEARERIAQERIAELERRPVATTGSGVAVGAGAAVGHAVHGQHDHQHGVDRHASATSGGMAGIRATGSGRHDDLSLINGVGADGQSRLNSLGVTSYRDIAGMTAADEAALEGRLGIASGTIARERWREQAELLETGRTTVTSRPI